MSGYHQGWALSLGNRDLEIGRRGYLPEATQQTRDGAKNRNSKIRDLSFSASLPLVTFSGSGTEAGLGDPP